MEEFLISYFLKGKSKVYHCIILGIILPQI